MLAALVTSNFMSLHVACKLFFFMSRIADDVSSPFAGSAEATLVANDVRREAKPVSGNWVL